MNDTNRAVLLLATFMPFVEGLLYLGEGQAVEAYKFGLLKTVACNCRIESGDYNHTCKNEFKGKIGTPN